MTEQPQPENLHVHQIAQELIAAAHKLFGPPGNPESPGGDYIVAVTRETDVPAYFRHMAKLAAAPRSMDLHGDYRDNFDQDAQMVMEAGFKQLLKDAALPPEQRRIIEDIQAFEEWTHDVTHEEYRKAEEAFVEQLRREGKWSE